MPRPWSFKVSCRIWHFQSVMNWHSHKCVWHAAFSLYSSRFVVTTNYLRLSINSGVKAEGHIWRSPHWSGFFWVMRIVLCNHVDCTNLTYIRALHIGVSVAVCVWCISLSDFGQCLGESQPARWRAPPHRSLRRPPGSRGGQLHGKYLPLWVRALPFFISAYFSSSFTGSFDETRKHLPSVLK